MSVGNSVQVTTTETGWVLTKTVNGQTSSMTIIDANKNGCLDANGDEITERTGTFSTAEILAAKNTIWKNSQQNSDKKITVGDYLNEQKTVEQEEAQAEAFERQQRQQRMAQYNANSGKKSNFWGKASMILGALCGLGGGFFSNGWQYNSGSFNDWNLRLFSTGVNGLAMTSNMLGAVYGNQLNATNYMTGGSTNMFGPDFFNQMMSAHNEYLQQRQEQFDEMMETFNQANEKAKAQREAEATAQTAKELLEKYQDEDAQIDETNKAKLNDIYQPSKKAEDYTAEDKAILEKIKNYPQIPYEAIDDENEGKLNTQLAAQVNKLIADYRNNNMPEVVNGIISETDYNTLVSMIEKAKTGTLTKDDITAINEIIKNAPKPESEDKEE